jgi:hypothetical protein
MGAQSLLVVRASIEGWVSIGVVMLGVLGVGERLWKRWEGRTRGRAHEGVAAGGSPSASPAEDGVHAPGRSPLLESLRQLWIAFRDVIENGVSWVGLVFLLSLSALFWLESLMLRLGCPAGVATGPRYVDGAVLIVTGAWLLTGVRSERRSLRTRLQEASALALVCLGTAALVIATGSLTYGAVCLLFGGIAFLKGFS